mmetsp:Transcript_53431/g.159486  ORF Transcript_53431/g.159486 Transcript_53431/m.159486 type:complete len:218 (+) Transcript_53431:3-656(+)
MICLRMASVLVLRESGRGLHELAQHGAHRDAAADDSADADHKSAPSDLLCVVGDPDWVDVHAEEDRGTYQLVGHERPGSELVAMAIWHTTGGDGGRRDGEVILESEGLGALKPIQRLRGIQQLPGGRLHEAQGVDGVAHVLRRRGRLVEVGDVGGNGGAVRADVEVAGHLIRVEVAVDAAALAPLLAPPLLLLEVHPPEDRHVEGGPVAQRPLPRRP